VYYARVSDKLKRKPPRFISQADPPILNNEEPLLPGVAEPIVEDGASVDGGFAKVTTSDPSSSGEESAVTVWDMLMMLVFVLTTVMYIVLDKLVAITAADFPFAKNSLSTLSMFFLGFPLILLIQSIQGIFKFSENSGGVLHAVLVGVIFALNNIMNDLGNRGNVIPGPIVALIGKLTVPMALVVDAVPCWLRPHTKYHYAGGMFLVLGVALTLWLESDQLDFHDDAAVTILDLCLLLGSVVPAAVGVAVAGVFLERNPNVSNIYFWSCVILAEVCVLPALAFLNSYVTDLPTHDIWSNLVDGSLHARINSCIINVCNFHKYVSQISLLFALSTTVKT
jgi:hypothetical protein